MHALVLVTVPRARHTTV